jgi:RNA polymerase sigma-70 factor, ECF subfamily
MRWQDRAHFFAVSARLMRRVLVDLARARASLKRGGTAQTISLDEQLVPGDGKASNLIALHDALEILEKLDPRKGQVVELKFLVGSTFRRLLRRCTCHLAP